MKKASYLKFRLINFIKKNWQLSFIGVVLLNIFLSLWYFLHGDLNFQTDIARDFLLLHEIEVKKIMLIGARAGAQGLFHGPLWPYLNFPFYLLGNGDPLVVSWFWIFLLILFYVSSFWVADKLFGRLASLIYLVFMSFYMIPWVREITHPQMGMFIMPIYFYLLWRYLNTIKIRYLIGVVLLAGVLIQLEVASGAPFFILSFISLVYMQIKKRKYTHMLSFLLLLIPLSTYIVFDLRHNFFMTQSLLNYIKGNPKEQYVGFLAVFKNRLEYITSMAMPLLTDAISANRVLSLIFLGVFILETVKNKKKRALNLYFLYFFFGYFLISLTNRYYLLVQHFMAFIPLVFMFMASLISSRYAKYLVLIFLFIIVANENEGFKTFTPAYYFIGKSQFSWKFLSQMTNQVFSGPEKDFGYFIYSPDKLAYQPKYALVYGQKQHPEKNSFYFTKKPVTYVISAPPPRDDPYMTGDWWTVNSIKIDKKPQSVTVYPNGYKVERYQLTDEEQAVPFDEFEDTGIFFR